ncbi:MAG: glycosyltransferase family 1 protein [Luteolibacter sp.]
MKVFFDISSLVEYVRRVDRYSGIQRVLSMLISEVSLQISPENLYLAYVRPNRKTHQCLRFDEVKSTVLMSPQAMRRLFHPGAVHDDFSPKVLGRYKNSPVKYYLQRLKLDMFSILGYDKPFCRYHATARNWRKERFSTIIPKRSKSVSHSLLSDVASPGDKLILLDSSWQKRHSGAFLETRKIGMIVYTLVHDLIPLLAASTSGANPATFYHWLRDSINYTDHYIANSEATHADLAKFLGIYGKNQPVSVLPLSQAGLNAVPAEAAPSNGPETGIDRNIFPEVCDMIKVADHIRALLNTPYVLCVGTIEARKNGWRLAAAWKYLVDQGKVDLPRLVFAGRRGWGSNPFDDLLAGTGNVYGYVSVIESPSDEELEFLYKNCLFLAMPSLYEGWGLPVGEALGYGKTALISNSTSLPEVGQNYTEYCDPNSIRNIAEAVAKLVDHPERIEELENRIKSGKLRSWSHVAQDLVQIIR